MFATGHTPRHNPPRIMTNYPLDHPWHKRHKWHKQLRRHHFVLNYYGTLALSETGAAQAAALRHRSGLRLYLLACDSRESAFSYCFATPPENDKGLPHIVEHAVFCGSRRYPLKEPFANLQKTSVCSFLNAMTYPDQTLYPAASAFAPDFMQLFKVYGDAVFYPLLEDQALAQEGLRQSPEGLDGIVFNEMQGYYGDFDAYVADCSLRNLFRLETSAGNSHAYQHYSYDAGGDPHAIAAIDCRDYHEIRDYHRRYYSPQNCRIVLYGSILRQPEQLAELLHFLDSELTGPEQPKTPAEPQANESSYDSLPQRQVLYRTVVRPKEPGEQEDPKENAEQGEARRSIMFSWVLPPPQSVRQLLEYRLLAELLLGHSGAVLELALLRSGWGADLCFGSGLELELAAPVLRCGLSAYRLPKGSEHPERTEAATRRFSQLIFASLKDFCEQAEAPAGAGLESLWQGALNSLEYEEYSLGEHGGEEGICALERCLQMARASHFLPLTADGEQVVFDSLQAFSQLEALRSEGLAAFARQLRRYTLDNPHWTVQLFEEVSGTASEPGPPPELRLSERELAQHREAFADYRMRKDTPALSARIAAMLRSEFGELPPELLCEREIIPVHPEQTRKAASAEQAPQLTFFCNPRSSEQNLVQLDLNWEISNWSHEQLALLPLLLDLLEEMSLPGLSYSEVARQKSVYIGHWDSELNSLAVFRPQAGQPALRSFVHIQLSFLPREWRRGLELFWKLLGGCDWDEKEDRLPELLRSRHYEKTQDLCASPLSYALRRSRARLAAQLSQVPPTAAAVGGSTLESTERSGLLPEASGQLADQSEWLHGLGQAELLSRLCLEPERQLPRLIADFRSLQVLLLRDAPLSCAATIPLQWRTELQEQLVAGLRSAEQTAQEAARRAKPDSSVTEPGFARWAAMLATLSSPARPLSKQSIELWQGAVALEYLSIALPAPSWSYLPQQRAGSAQALLHPALLLLTRLLQSGPAWEKIRLQQGAYGVRVLMQNGFLLLCSSQDPDACNSVDLFHQAIAELRFRAQNPDPEFQEEFEAALVQTLAEKIKQSPPNAHEHARTALQHHQARISHDDLCTWLECLRQLQIADLERAAAYVLELWPQKAICIFAAPHPANFHASKITQGDCGVESHYLPRYTETAPMHH